MKTISKLLLILLTLVTFTSGKVLTTVTKPTETIVFGRFKISGITKHEKKTVIIHFNERLWAKNAAWIDENGFFYLKMPLKKNFLALVEYRIDGGYYKNIPDNYVSVNIQRNEEVYYIGDITIDWTPDNSDKRQNNGGVIVALGEANKSGKKINIKVDFNEETIKDFKQLFIENKKEIKTELITIE